MENYIIVKFQIFKTINKHIDDKYNKNLHIL